MQGEAVAFLFVYFGVWGGGAWGGGGHTKKKNILKRKKDICYILVYKFNENRDVCITKQNIYFR